MDADFSKLCSIILEQRPDNYMGMTSINMRNDACPDVRILKAWLGTDPDSLFFGEMKVVFAYAGRAFQLEFHVWEPHQPPYMANRITVLNELVLENSYGFDSLVRKETDFGCSAAWLYTPDSALDSDGRIVRTVIKACKQYSVSHQLCKKFRTAWPKQAVIEP